ncbi:hypothetical protein ABGB12_20830 [Actinocorallia sp. B10E7]|uniref:hypothetical protein n=1 Tax=Actinocorallia sp. B10E7 TaxID=3153558 RepID=UPI00325DE324
MGEETKTPLGRVLPRRAQSMLDEALGDTRVVLVTGARQCGKNTLVRLSAEGPEAEWRDLDSTATRLAAVEDPDGFVDVGGRLVVDE